MVLKYASFLTLLVDEDEEVRSALEKVFGNCLVDEKNKNLVIQKLALLARGNLEFSKNSVKMLLGLGFGNDRRKLRLFDLDERETAFEVVNLNLNHEPIHLSRMVLAGIQEIINQVKDAILIRRNKSQIQRVTTFKFCKRPLLRN